MALAFVTPSLIKSFITEEEETFEGNIDSNGFVRPIKKERTLVDNIYSAVQTMLTVFALYLSFKRNCGFSLGEFLAACCCSPFYIAYAFATPGQICPKSGNVKALNVNKNIGRNVKALNVK